MHLSLFTPGAVLMAAVLQLWCCESIPFRHLKTGWNSLKGNYGRGSGGCICSLKQSFFAKPT